MASSFVRRSTSAHPRPPTGTIPSPSNPHLPLISTGVPSLDDILGSGQPLGSTFSVLAPDEHSGWGRLIERYWIAQGLASGHDVVLVGGGPDPVEAEEELRGLVKGCMWIEDRAMAGRSGKDVMQEEPDSDAEGLEPDSGNKTKIAWRYEKMKKFQTTVGAGGQAGGNQAVSSFSHTLNLTTPIPSALITHLEQTSQLTYIPLTPLPDSNTSPSRTTPNAAYSPFRGALEGIKKTLTDRGVHDDRVPGASGRRAKDGAKGKKDSGTKVVRVLVHDLGSLDWGDRVAGYHIHRFLFSLRQLIRHSTAAVFITYPPSLASSPPSIAARSPFPNGPQCHPAYWLDSISHASDACITLQGFASSPTLDLSFPLSHGLVHIHTLPQLHSLAPPAYKHSNLLGLAAGSGSSGQNNLAFRLKRKRFVIETLHLGVEGGVGERRTEPSRTGGAVRNPRVAASDEHEHAGHDHSAHSHGKEEQEDRHTAGIRVEHEGVDRVGPDSRSIKESVDDLAAPRSEASDGVPPDKKGRKRVAFVQHDRPELYEF